MRQGRERQRPVAEADVEQAVRRDQRKRPESRSATPLGTPGLKRTARAGLAG